MLLVKLLLMVLVTLCRGFLRHHLLQIDSCQVFTCVLMRGQSTLALLVRVQG